MNTLIFRVDSLDLSVSSIYPHIYIYLYVIVHLAISSLSLFSGLCLRCMKMPAGVSPKVSRRKCPPPLPLDVCTTGQIELKLQRKNTN